MLFVVVLRTMASIVVLSLLISTATLVLPTGTMAPPYHLNYYCDYFYQSSNTHYSLRGGDSVNGLNCGVFYVTFYYGSGNTYWYVGAALSFKTIYKATSTTYALRGGYSNHGLNCGVFCVRFNSTSNGSYWYVGAALSFKPVSY